MHHKHILCMFISASCVYACVRAVSTGWSGGENRFVLQRRCVCGLLSCLFMLPGVSRSGDKSVAASQFCSFWLAKYDKLATLEFK